ncbi:MAG TPA: response regulator [Candidatus Paceibacterota bacterium]|nr:response regulator [Candidatus Pacearchaeota archaeon]HRZ51179.1 response regulator [Candidatus Paceibacterota bacterium]HSA36900.1 response regulator [Candidatus Paceibacterota bacterium]
MAKKILLVEDEDLIIKLLQKKLVSEGYDVTIASDGEEGMKALRQNKPELVLLDIVMPKKGGFEVLEEINQDADLRNIPVIIISNSGQPMELDRAQRLGVKDWLIKTEFDPKEVLEKVIKQIGK